MTLNKVVANAAVVLVVAVVVPAYHRQPKKTTTTTIGNWLTLRKSKSILSGNLGYFMDHKLLS